MNNLKKRYAASGKLFMMAALGGLMFSLGAAVTPTTVQAEKVTIRVASFLPARSMSVRGLLKPWIDGARKEAGDEVEIKEFWGGALGRAPAKQYDIVADGVADVSAVVPSYTPGRFPGFDIHELPYLTRSGVEASLAQWRMYEKGHIKGFEKVKLLGLFITSPYRIHTKNEIKSVNDLKGMKIRTSGAVMSNTVEFYGGVPMGIPLNQTTEALSRGVVDGVFLGYSALGVFRMDSIAKYHFEPPLGTGSVVAIMNLDTWNELSPKAQKVMMKYGAEAMGREGGGLIDRVDAKFEKQMRAKDDHKFVPATDRIEKQGREAFTPIYENWIKNNKNGRQAFNDYLKIIEDIRAGK